jgi:hypothetical protein
MTRSEEDRESPVEYGRPHSDAQEEERRCAYCRADLAKGESHRPGHPCYQASDGPRRF